VATGKYSSVVVMRNTDKNRTTRGQDYLLLFISLVTAILLLEILLRVMLPAPIVWKYPQESYIFDPEIGHWMEGNQRAFTHDKVVITNSQGLRDIEYPGKAPAGTRRILALGDSQTFGNGLDQSDTWPRQLETLRNSKNDSMTYQVVNSGLPASDTWQHEIIMKRMLEIYHPDAVILGFYVNDVVTRPDTVRFTQRNDRTHSSAKWIYLVKRSALLLSLRSAYRSIRQMWVPGEGFLLQDELLRGGSNSIIDKRWNQVERSMCAMREITDAYSIGFLVVALPRRDQVDGRLPADRYNQRLKEIFDRCEVRFTNMIDPLQTAFKVHGKSLFIPWDGHNTKIANHVIASEIAEIVPGLFVGGP